MKNQTNPGVHTMLVACSLLFACTLLVTGCSKKDNAPVSLALTTDTLNSLVIDNNQFQLAFDDEFSGNTLDRSKWNYRYGEKLGGNNLSRNVTVSNGALHILLKKETSFIETDTGYTNIPARSPYTCGGIISKGTFDTGYYECSVRFPPDSGWHTSFWTIQYYGTRKNEIDIEENTSGNRPTGPGGQYEYHCGAINWAVPSNSPLANPFGYKETIRLTNGIPLPDLSAAFHRYGCIVTDTSLSFYFDRQLSAHYLIQRYWKGMSINPANILLTSLALQGGENSQPAEAVFDYVRYYRRKPATP